MPTQRKWTLETKKTLSSKLAPILLFAVLTWWPLQGSAQVDGVEIQRLIGSGETLPDGQPGEEFTAFFDPSIASGEVLFLAAGNLGSVAFFLHSGGIAQRLNLGAPTVPGGLPGETWISFESISFDGTHLAFLGRGSSGTQGIYQVTLGGTLEIVADNRSPLPDGSEVDQLQGCALASGGAAFGMEALSGERAIYARTGGILEVVASTQQEIPGMPGLLFKEFGPPGPAEGDGVAFSGDRPDGETGIYTNLGGTLRVVADINTPVPGTTSNFSNLDHWAISGSKIAFLGEEGGPPTNFYVECDGQLSFLSSIDFGLPPGEEVIKVGEPAFSGRHVGVWIEGDQGTLAIYTNVDGQLTRLIGVGDMLGGLIIASIHEGIDYDDADRLVFVSTFTDGSQAAYVATVPIFADGFETGDPSGWSTSTLSLPQS